MAFLHPITQKEKTQSPKKENHKENNSGEVNRSHLINRTVSPQSFAAILKFIKLVLIMSPAVFGAALFRSRKGAALGGVIPSISVVINLMIERPPAVYGS